MMMMMMMMMMERDNMSCQQLRELALIDHDIGKVSKKNGFIWDFVPNIGPHPPTAHVWDKVLKKRFFYTFPKGMSSKAV